MVKVVLDTNILVSSLLTSGPPAMIVDLAAHGKVIPFYNDLIFQEYWDVLSRKKFGFSPFQVTRLMHDITRTGIAIENKFIGKVTTIDKDDQIFYDTALQAQAYLITGNLKHFPPEAFIVSPAQFITTISETGSS